MPISRIPAKTSNPFDSDDEGSGDRQKRGNSAHAAVVDKHGHSRGASADGVMKRSDQQKRADPSPNLFKARREPSQESGGESSGSRFRDSEFRGREALEYKSVEDLEGYSVQKSRETTSSVENCVRVVGEIREEATQTLSALHQQGEQIKRTHEMAVDIDQNLSKGEKLLGSLGGIFSRTWKPSKSQPITGPAISQNDSGKKQADHLNQRAALGLGRGKAKERHSPDDPIGPQSTHEIIQMEKRKQEDGLSEVSNVLEELKAMSMAMGDEISSQMVHLKNFDKDVTTLNERMDGANRRGRQLLKK